MTCGVQRINRIEINGTPSPVEHVTVNMHTVNPATIVTLCGRDRVGMSGSRSHEIEWKENKK